MTTHEILLAAQAAKLTLALADTDTKNAALEAMAVALVENSDAILAANNQDLAAARGRISDVMLDRLALTPARLAAMAKGMREVAALPDPVGAVLRKIVRPNGLLIEKTSVPMGVIAIIYESRPNVTSDAAALALKEGNDYRDYTAGNVRTLKLIRMLRMLDVPLPTIKAVLRGEQPLQQALQAQQTVAKPP